MSTKKIQADEYSLQYYRINAPIVMHLLFDSLTLTIGDYMHESEEEYLSEYPKQKVLGVFRNLRKEYLKNIVSIMNEKEEELRDLLLIPPNILLPEDKCYSKIYSEEDVKQLKNEIDELEKLYLTKKACKCTYEKELETLENLLTSYQNINGFANKLKKIQKVAEKSKLKEMFNVYDKCVSALMENLDFDVEELKF
ncbi:protein MIS12 homolog [Onthophagus taurus]|uniref:protein MIS12 homolog n=1 Tax=Onthophagus taurus TaxID=166361 RepID=UPI0039BE017C